MYYIIIDTKKEFQLEILGKPMNSFIQIKAEVFKDLQRAISSGQVINHKGDLNKIKIYLNAL